MARAESLTAYDLMNGMRALAAVAVVLSHVRNILFVDARAGMSAPWMAFYFVTGFGHQAVMIFFVLSGYWIAKTVERRNDGSGFAWSYYGIDRLSRLWIVLIPALLLGGLLDGIGQHETMAPLYLGIQGTNSLTYDVAPRLTLSNLAGSIAFTQTLLVYPFGSNGPLWSLANEFWYYVWYPPLYQLLNRQKPALSMSLIALVTMLAFRQLLPGFVCWLFGALVFYGARTTVASLVTRSWTNAALVTASVIFWGVLGLSRTVLTDSFVQDVSVSGCFALLLFVVIRTKKTYPHWLGPLCRYGAGSSYSLYVLHFPLVIFLAAFFVAPAHRFPPSGGLLFSFVAIVVVSILYAYLVSAVTEANTVRLRVWLRRRYSECKALSL